VIVRLKECKKEILEATTGTPDNDDYYSENHTSIASTSLFGIFFLKKASLNPNLTLYHIKGFM